MKIRDSTQKLSHTLTFSFSKRCSHKRKQPLPCTSTDSSSSASMFSEAVEIAKSRPRPPPCKRPRLLLNLYDEAVGYEFGALAADEVTVSSLSPLIPYSEDDLLRAVDAEELPSRVLKALEPHLIFRRGAL